MPVRIHGDGEIDGLTTFEANTFETTDIKHPDNTGDANITLSSTGSSTFAGVLQGDQRVVINGAGGKSGTSETLLNYAGDGSTVTASITADGNATFRGDVIIGDSASSTTESGCYLGDYGGIVVNAVTDSTSDRLFLGKNKNNTVAEINAF